jgi:predicted DsbA family dithiol-disulfide isomerase
LSRVVVHVAYFTDPLCPWSWAAEPVVRRVQVEFSGQVAFTYLMVGVAREVDAPHVLEGTLDAVAASGMPADPRVWIEGAPRTSHTACLAVKAAGEQRLDGPFLRRLRVGLFCHRERIDNPEAFLAAARAVPGLDVGRLDVDMRSNAMVELFGADRERAAQACGDRRPSVPAFSVDGGEPVGPEGLREAIVAAGATAGALPDVEAALATLAPLGTAEVAEVCGLPPARASIELWRLAADFRARAERLVCGELWRAA